MFASYFLNKFIHVKALDLFVGYYVQLPNKYWTNSSLMEKYNSFQNIKIFQTKRKYFTNKKHLIRSTYDLYTATNIIQA